MAFYSEVEAKRVCPASWRQVKMPLVPKGSGGKRTVVFTPTLYRVMLSARRPDLRVWDDANGCPDDAARPGVGAERAAERAAAEMEMLRAQRRAAAIAVWDVAAFFDSLGIRRVWRLAQELGYPLRLAGLAIRLACGPSHIAMQGAIRTAGINPACGVLVGDPQAMAVAKMYLAIVGQRVVDMGLQAARRLYVGDMRLVISGAQGAGNTWERRWRS